MGGYFPERKSVRGGVKVELHLSNYTAKSHLRNAKVLIHQNLLKTLI